MIVNGETREVDVEPRETLLRVLRDKLGLLGTKESCSEGSCGACTVLIDGKPVYSCLMFAVTTVGKKIQTIEDLEENGKLHPLQSKFVERNVTQCGYCNPGMILTAKALLEENPNPTVQEVKEYLSGNLCRCTGYMPIVKAILEVAKEGKNERRI